MEMEIKNYFSNKYKRENNITEQECKMYLQNINIPKISVEEGASLGDPIRPSEIFSALNDMSNSKTPGNDGLPKEFFVAFFDLIGQDLLNSYNTSYATGYLSSSQTQAVITLIEKVGKDNRKLSGWRPISLINTDTKIIGKILVARVKHILPQIIDSDQYAFVPEGFIDEATRLIADILEYTKMENIGGIFFAADFAAAFDSLDYTFLFAALEAFGFPDTFVKWVKVLYINSESCVMNYGKSTGYFKLMRGAKQGDPLAPYLFLIAIEVLAAKVRNDENICGIMVNNCITKQCLFADDATFFKNLSSLKQLMRVIEEFSKFSSLRLNRTKSEVSWIGSRRYSLEKCSDFSWTDLTKKSIKILGIHYTYAKDLSNKLNFDRVVGKLTNILNIWNNRHLTIYGRKEVIQTLGLSQIYYVSKVLDPPIKDINRIKQLITDFIWNGRRPKVKYKSLIDEYKNGGIKLPDIETKFKTQRIICIKKLINSDYR